MVFVPQRRADYELGDDASATSATGRWVRGGHAIELVLDRDNASPGADAGELEAPATRGFTAHDVIDARIDPCAQSALLRMRDAGGDTLADAAGLLGAVKSGALAGMFGANLQASVKLATKLGTVWWELLPAGQDAALITDPTDPYGPPTIVFRAIQTSGTQRCLVASRLDPALRAAWRSFRLVEIGSAVQCESLPETAWTEGELGGPTVLANIIPPFCMQPRVPSPRPGPAGRDELVSWCHPFDTSPLIGQIYFATNSSIPGADDKQALDRLVKVFNEFGDRFVFDPIDIHFLGYADYRSTTYPGGNKALAGDRARACLNYFMNHLNPKAKQSVWVKAIGEGVDPELAKALATLGTKGELILKRMRMTKIERPDPRPIIPRRHPIPPKDCAAARDRGRKVMRSWPGMFTEDEQRHLTQMCDDRAVRDAFLNGMDPKFNNIVHGLGGKMTDAEAEAFANRFHVCTELMHPFSTGPNADDLDVVGALKGLHSKIDMAIDNLIAARAKEDVTGFVNQRRAKLTEFVLRGVKNPASIYYRWF